MTDIINKAPHYQTEDPNYEVYKVLEAWNLTDCFYIANAVTYLARCRKKGQKEADLKKAIWNINREIELDKKGEVNKQEKSPQSKEQKLQTLIFYTFYDRFKDAKLRLAVWTQVCLAVKHNFTHSMYYLIYLRRDIDKIDPYFYDTLVTEVDKILNEQNT